LLDETPVSLAKLATREPYDAHDNRHEQGAAAA
jgi:hypothetical protein